MCEPCDMDLKKVFGISYLGVRCCMCGCAKVKFLNVTAKTRRSQRPQYWQVVIMNLPFLFVDEYVLAPQSSVYCALV
jgi:hypothetical protein